MQVNLADEEPRQPASGHNEKRNHTKSRARTSPNSRQIVRPFIAGDCYFLIVEERGMMERYSDRSFIGVSPLH
jgi:hypothetical protein